MTASRSFSAAHDCPRWFQLAEPAVQAGIQTVRMLARRPALVVEEKEQSARLAGDYCVNHKARRPPMLSGAARLTHRLHILYKPEPASSV